MSGWYLEDVVGRARDHPDQFFIPSEQKRRACAVGDLVCLHFVVRNPTAEGPRAERMWVEVAERLGEDASVSYRGVLTNQPANIGGSHDRDGYRIPPRPCCPDDCTEFASRLA